MIRDLDLTTLRLFVTVCESRSMARAAEQSNIVASAISKRLAHLEDIVGTSLLIRSQDGIEPTIAGESMLEHAREMLASAERIERDMDAHAAGINRQVRILAGMSALAGSLADDVALFLRDPAHRDIRVEMEERSLPDVVREIREGSSSIGVCWDAADPAGLESRPYRSDHLAAIVHPSHPLAAYDTLGFEQALEFEFVRYPAANPIQITLQRAAAIAGKPLLSSVVASTIVAALRVVRANLAIGVVPREVMDSLVVNHGLRVIPFTDCWAKRSFGIYFRSEEGLSCAAQAMVRHLAARASFA